MYANYCVCLPTCCCLTTFPLSDVIHTLFCPVAWQHYIVMSSVPAKKSAGNARCVSQDPSTHRRQIKSRLKTVLGCVLSTSNAKVFVYQQKRINNCLVLLLIITPVKYDYQLVPLARHTVVRISFR